MHKKLGGLILILALFLFPAPIVLNAQEDFGRTGIDNAEVHYLSHQALSNVADSMVARLLEKQPGFRSLIICGSAECNDLIQARLAFEVFETESGDLIAEYERIDQPTRELVAQLREIPPSPLMEGNAVYSASGEIRESVDGLTQTIGSIEGLISQSGTALTSAFGLINLIRNTTVTVESSSTVVDDSVLTTAIAARLKSRPETADVNVYLPVYSQVSNVAVADSKVFKTYRSLLGHLRTAEDYDSSISLHSGLRVEPDDAATIAALRTLNQRTAAFLESLAGTNAPPPADDEEGPASPSRPDFEILEGLIVGEKFDAMLEESGMILQVKIIKMIGTQLTKNNLILGKRVRFSGSATVQYVLTDRSGKLLYANTEIFHTGFKKMKEIRKTDN